MRKFSLSGIIISGLALISSVIEPASGQYYRSLRPGVRVINIVNNIPGAQILSAATQNQPGATQRYYQVVTDRPGTCSKGSGSDEASFTLDSASCIYSITLAAAGDGSSQLTKTLPLIFTPTDGTPVATQNIIQTLTTISAPQAVSTSYTTDFTGTAGVALDTLPGWAISRTGSSNINTPILDGNGNIIGRYAYDGGNEGTWAVLYTPSGVAAGTRTTFTIPKGDSSYSSMNLFAVASDYNNGVGVTITPRNVAAQSNASFTRQSGTKTDFSGLGNMSWSSSDTIDVIFDVSTDGNILSVTWNGATSFTKTYDLTGKTKGTGFGFSGIAPYAAALDSGVLVKSISFLRGLTNLNVTDAPLFSANNVATYTLSWSGNKPTRLQQRLYDQTTGNPVTQWMTGDSVVTGTTSGTISQTVTAPNAGNYIVKFRPLNDTPVVVTAATATKFLANVQPFQMMYNVRSANYYQPSVMLNNWGVYSEVQNGKLYIPTDGMDGFANVQSTPGTIWTSTDPSISVVSSNSTNGTLRVNVIDGTNTVGRSLNWSGVRPTQFDVTRDGQSGIIAPEWIAGIEGEGLRDLDMVLGNSAPIEGSTFVRNTSADKFYRNDYGVGPDEPYQNIIEGVAAKAAATPSFNKYWTVLASDLTPEQVTARFTYMRDHLPSTMKIIIEDGNEEWNSQFLSSLRTRLQGVREGWYGAATYNNPQPTLSVAFAGEGTVGNTSSPATAAGGLVLFNYYDSGYGSGYVVWRAKQNVPVGTTIAANAYWEIDTSIDASIAGKRFRSIRNDRNIEIARTVFGETRFQSQIVPVVMGQAGGIYDQFQIERTFVPGYWAKVKGVGTGFYFGPAAGIDPTTVTASQLETSLRANMPVVKAAVRQVVIDALAMDKVPYFYEGMTHPDYKAYLETPNYKTQWDALFNSDAGKLFMSDISYFMKSNVPGVVTGYDLVSAPPWSLKNNWRDLNNKRRLGWLEGLSRTQ